MAEHVDVIERWNAIKRRPLLYGGHNPDGEMCVMEAVAYVAGEKWSASPECASPVITAFLVSWNDSLDKKTRQILKPYVVRVVGTRGTAKQEEKRAWLATDWLVRECAPALLRLAGLTEHAETLENLAALTTTTRAKKAQPKIAAAWDAAWDAAGAAAWDAAWDAARKKLAPTAKALQKSALLLLDRMIEVKPGGLAA